MCVNATILRNILLNKRHADINNSFNAYLSKTLVKFQMLLFPSIYVRNIWYSSFLHLN